MRITVSLLKMEEYNNSGQYSFDESLPFFSPSFHGAFAHLHFVLFLCFVFVSGNGLSQPSSTL